MNRAEINLDADETMINCCVLVKAKTEVSYMGVTTAPVSGSVLSPALTAFVEDPLSPFIVTTVPPCRRVGACVRKHFESDSNDKSVEAHHAG